MTSTPTLGATRSSSSGPPRSLQIWSRSGSDTFLHATTSIAPLVAQLTGVHRFELGMPVKLYLQPAHAYLFDARGELVLAPKHPGRVERAH